MKNLSSYNQDLSVPRKKDVDAKQDKITINGIVQGDGTGNLSAVETVNADLLDLNPAAVGLGNVDNTSDANKPISAATQTALNEKLDKTAVVDVTADAIKGQAADAKSVYDKLQALPTGTDLSLGITSAAVGNIVKVKAVDAAGKPTIWESIVPTLSMLKTRYDTIVDYTFNGTSTLSTAEGLSDYILWNGCKAVWNKDAQGDLLKAVRMWGYIEFTKAVTQEDVLSVFKLSAACRASYFYQDTPSSWYYGDDTGNGVGTYELNDEWILNSKSIPINRTTYGWCDHIARFGAVQSFANKNTWTGTLRRSFTAASVLSLTQANYYKDYIYAAMLMVGNARSDYIIPDGVRIVVVAEVIDE